MKKFIFLLLLISLFTGCASQVFLIKDDDSDREPTKEKMQVFFIGGIGQTQVIDAAEICGSAKKVVKVEAQMTFLDWFLTVITEGIFSPRTAKVYCSR